MMVLKKRPMIIKSNFWTKSPKVKKYGRSTVMARFERIGDNTYVNVDYISHRKVDRPSYHVDVATKYTKDRKTEYQVKNIKRKK